MKILTSHHIVFPALQKEQNPAHIKNMNVIYIQKKSLKIANFKYNQNCMFVFPSTSHLQYKIWKNLKCISRKEMPSSFDLYYHDADNIPDNVLRSDKKLTMWTLISQSSAVPTFFISHF